MSACDVPGQRRRNVRKFLAGGRLALRMAGDAAKDAVLLQVVVQFVNRMGHGDAPRRLETLDVGKFQSQMLSKVADFCATVRLATVESGGESTT
ncbi:hypothetical protein [Paraburkholderia graminis]|uniref:hypothetical protein n=1 Tax=Paraburkholderia graminis TaxID=60548 RepID=UPI0031D2DB9E